MAAAHRKATIISMAIVATGITVLLHEGVGHGVTSWVRGGVPTEHTSNHLTSLYDEDRRIKAGGTLVNLAAGTLALFATFAVGIRTGQRYFWLLASHNLLTGTDRSN